MKKQFRLLKNRDFKKVIDSKKRIFSKYFIIYNSPNTNMHLRVGITMNKKIGNAVKRNKIKRQINNILKHIAILDQAIDLVVIVKNEYDIGQFETTKADMRKGFEKIGVKVNVI